ncbi:glycine--tRNA ligase subunit beta [Helicobacter sp. MIT 21-1697]|uniref:glycine--tRNA ligase subunit beta n=1 Tax=Helicobacter sp. MIT 21-1697 TaxID=2993733 RepID=UPI00224A8568|nr:glycine--tRNA ligase subunit beta [Helicobacter sp. MIT 21-1697]MCX2717933.1 glycine--tRNA ligase subunit beta [Helicobacter sp. MIT 21-1697]
MKSSYLPLLIEILTEELPALPFLKELPYMVEKWQKIAQKHHITSAPTLYFTPRRIVLYEQNFATHTQDMLIESYGPPIAIAFIDGDTTKGLSKAGESFFKKLGLSPNTPYETRLKDNKEVLYYAKMQQGAQTQDIIGEILAEWLKALHFGKSMFWGDLNESFIRPVRNILVLLGEENIAFNAFGLQSKAQTYLHRDVSFEPFAITSVANYFTSLHNGKVILEQDKRRAMILEQIATIESQEGIKVEIDEELLNEVVAITEYPRAAYGSFDKAFLQLPNEVIITSMKENQRYFATYKDGRLHNGFVLVSNSTAANLAPIVQGNQKVLKARLSDAVFFYENDLKNGFTPEKLDQILFVDGLGSLLDKTKRESIIALTLLKSYAHKIDMEIGQSQEILSTAVKYAKADLLTEMVYEFTDLQGIIGYYYAQKFGMHPLVAQAIKEQYLPTGEDSPLPSHILSALLALSIKLDNIFALFSIDKIPSGSKDPFALRRAANGVIKIIWHYGLDFDLLTDMPRLYQAGGYKPSDMQRIESFFLERLEGMLKVNPSLIRCVLNARVNNAKVRNLNTIIRNVEALSAFFEKSDKQALITLFKRVANILNDDITPSHIDESLLKLPQEIALYEALKALKTKEFKDISEHIAALFALKEPLEAFFASVLVNDNNNAMKTNRQMLILSIYNEFLRIGDIKDITL